MNDERSGGVGRAVFLSYASQDAEAAKRIAEALRAAGVEVWFDQNELVGGDAWDAKIRGQIASCALFVPVISAATQARLEGYFRIEWKLAAQRTHAMAEEKAFLLPVVIDATRDAEAKVPGEFKAVQWTRLPGGEGAEKFCARVKQLLGGDGVEPGRPRSGERGEGAASPVKPAATRRLWLIPAALGLAAVLAVTTFLALRPMSEPGTGGSASTAAKSAPLTEAQQLVAKARKVFEEGDLYNRETYALTEALLKKAEELDVGEAEAWALHASVSGWIKDFGFDNSTDRAPALKMQAERAIKLAPTSVAARLAYATVNEDEAESILPGLLAERPDDWRVLHGLARLRRRQEKTDEAVQLLQQARRLSDDHQAVTGDLLTVLVYAGRFAEAEAVVEEVLPRRSCGRVLEFDVRLKLNWRGDAAAAAAALERWPAWLLKEDRGAHCAAQVWMWNRQPAKALAILGGFPRDYFRHHRFTGPRAALTAWLHELAGNTQAARSDWRVAIQVVDRELAAMPASTPALHWKAWALARLGDRPAAEPIWRELIERRAGTFRANDTTGGLAGLALTVGHIDEAFAELERLFTGKQAFQGFLPTRATLDLNPCFDGIRTDPRFVALRAAAPAPEEKPGKKTSAVPTPAPNDKSLVVLPLENLSPDPEDAFFTGGMHFEIIQTLSRIPDLKVISRDSALALRESTLSLAEKARKVGVTNVVIGSVRRAGARVVIALELRRARDEALLWTKTYERDASGAYAIQGEVAAEVARVLQARDQRGSFAGARYHTQNAQAYRLFQKLRDAHLYENSLTSAERIAQAEKIVELDAEFMPAVTLLSMAHASKSSGTREAAERKKHADLARQWAEKAAALVPGGAGDGALANFYSVTRDYERALLYAENTARASPNDATSHAFVASALEGLGRNAEALAAYERALALDPMNVGLHGNRLELLVALRRPDGFEAACAKWREIQPQVSPTLFFPGRFRLYGEIPKELGGLRVYDTALWLWRTRRFADLISLLDAELARGDMAVRMRFDVLEKKAQALRRTDRLNDLQTVAQEMNGIAGQLLDDDDAEYAYDSSRVAKAKAFNGEVDAAVSTLRRAIATTNSAQQMWQARVQRTYLAEILAAAGRSKECVALLVEILATGSPTLSVPSLRLDPTWDNVREDPAFKALLADPKNSAPL